MKLSRIKWLAFLTGAYTAVAWAVLTNEYLLQGARYVRPFVIFTAIWLVFAIVGAQWGGRSHSFSWRQAPRLVMWCSFAPLISFFGLGFLSRIAFPLLALAVAPTAFLSGMGLVRLCGWMHLKQIESPLLSASVFFVMGIATMGSAFALANHLLLNGFRMLLCVMAIGLVVYLTFEGVSLHARVNLGVVLFMVLWMGFSLPVHQAWENWTATRLPQETAHLFLVSYTPSEAESPPAIPLAVPALIASLLCTAGVRRLSKSPYTAFALSGVLLPWGMAPYLLHHSYGVAVLVIPALTALGALRGKKSLWTTVVVVCATLAITVARAGIGLPLEIAALVASSLFAGMVSRHCMYNRPSSRKQAGNYLATALTGSLAAVAVLYFAR